MKEIDDQIVSVLMFLKMKKISLDLSFWNINIFLWWNFIEIFKTYLERNCWKWKFLFVMIYASHHMCFEKDIKDFQKFLMYSEFIQQ